jgi:hypothetical protein
MSRSWQFRASAWYAPDQANPQFWVRRHHEYKDSLGGIVRNGPPIE